MHDYHQKENIRVIRAIRVQAQKKNTIGVRSLRSPLSSPFPTPINKGKVNVVYEVNIKTKKYFCLAQKGSQ